MVSAIHGHQSATGAHVFLTGTFSAFTFKVIIDRCIDCHFKPCLPVDFVFSYLSIFVFPFVV